MPIYLYRCEDCKTVIEVEMGMLDDHPQFFGHHGCGSNGRLVRQFTIPGMTAIKTEEDGGWNIKAPGEVGGPQRNKKWRDRFVKKRKAM